MRRGISTTTAAIAETISTNSIQLAPAALAKSVAAVAITKGASASISTLTLIKGALKIMAWTKTQTAVTAGVILILAAGTTTTLVKYADHHSAIKFPSTPAEKQRFDAETSRLVNGAKIACLYCIMFADSHQNRWPKNFAELQVSHPDCHLTDSDWKFVSSGNRNDFTDPGHTILFYERTPRPSPDRDFVKIYAMADGSIQTVASPTENFAASEQKFGYFVKN
ncbi:MAG: hypothetical protein ACLQSR_12195 [Limisphaerales bacterium]